MGRLEYIFKWIAASKRLAEADLRGGEGEEAARKLFMPLFDEGPELLSSSSGGVRRPELYRGVLSDAHPTRGNATGVARTLEQPIRDLQAGEPQGLGFKKRAMHGTTDAELPAVLAAEANSSIRPQSVISAPATVPSALPPPPPPPRPAHSSSATPSAAAAAPPPSASAARSFKELGHVWLVPDGKDFGSKVRKHHQKFITSKAQGGCACEVYRSGRTRLVVASPLIHLKAIVAKAGGIKALPPHLRTRIVTPAWVKEATKAATAGLPLPAIDAHRWSEPVVQAKQRTQEDRKRAAAGSGAGEEKLKRAKFGAGYACMLSGTIQAANLNDHLTHFIDQLVDVYEVMGHDKKHERYGFNRASACLRSFPRRIEHEDLKELSSRRGIGPSILETIRDILDTGRSSRLDGLLKQQEVRAGLEFIKIWGVGPATARELYTKGFRSIADLRARAKLRVLNREQWIGLRHYEDLLEKIPRAEAAEIEAYVRSVVNELEPGVSLTTCGSYRRGKATCGDVDILLCPPDGAVVSSCNILCRLVAILEDRGFLTDRLAFEEKHDGDGKSSYMGVCRLPGEGRLHRRIDIKVYPREQYAFAILYFTGSSHFNRSMRSYAKTQKKMCLSDQGLVPTNYFNGRKTGTCGEPVRCKSEEDIFKALGLEYKAPHERNCYDMELVEQKDERMKED